jgi:uncharacterized protein
MPNRLTESNSPYLLQHADNPVDWYPWRDDALQKARQEDKPIFLSIGYAACHWCHVMAHESFEDPQTAAIMNEHFVNIKVDREERPDLDDIYMNAVVALTGHGGWPMSVFLTPEGKPFYGGTYFPPGPRHGMPSFRDVLLGVARAWREDRQRLFQGADQLADHIRNQVALTAPGGSLDPETLDNAALSLAQSYDWKDGGWGKAPKFPQAMAVEFLLRRASRGDSSVLEIATHALRAMARGGMYDVIGGGFSRYSTDDFWLVPHFEKMLYDNALLAQAYLHAFLLSGEAHFRQVCEETLDFIVRELSHPQGGFYSSLDADSEGEEGKFYVWTPDEIRSVLQDPQDADFIIAAYGITEAGNFEGKNVLQRRLDDAALADRFGLSEDEISPRLRKLHERLRRARDQRIWPGTDDKVLTSWNALALTAFAEAARYLNRDDYLEVAMRNARFLLQHLHPGDRLLRSWREGRAEHNAFLEDYAALIIALLALYQSDPDPQWFNRAVSMAEDMVTHFIDPQGGFFDTRSDHEPLVTRPKNLQDNATSSGNSLAATALLLLSAYTAWGEWREIAENMLATMQPAAKHYPTAFGNWLSALDFALYPVQEVAILGDLQSPATGEMISAVWESYRPNLVGAISEYPPPPDSPPLLKDRPLVDGKPTAYVCQNFVCHQPVTSADGLLHQLDANSMMR